MRGPENRWLWLAAAMTVIAFVAMSVYAVYAETSTGSIVSQLLVSGVFAATGLAAWARRPQNRIGPLMIVFAWTFMAIIFTKPVVPLLIPLGLAAFIVSGTVLAYIVLAYPSGELRTTSNRALVAFTAIGIGAPRVVRLLATEQMAPGDPNPWYVLQNPGIVPAMADIPYVADLVVVATLLVVVIARWLRASGPLRRILSPVLLPTTVLFSTIIASTATEVVSVPDDVKDLLDVVQLLTRMVLPIGFLIGILQTRMARSAVADLVVDLGSDPTPGRLGEALANALGDPSLEVGYWSGSASGYVDAAGTRLELPEPSADRGVTFLERDGIPLAAILHDPALLDDPGLVAAVTSALRLAVENERLQEEVEAQLDEVRASRARLVEAGDTERKRIERDLHDGAQQRLVALTLALRLARTRAGGDIDPELAASLDAATIEARAALNELRELAHGIHPQILTGSGLGPAIESLAARSPIGVSVEVEPGRFSSAVEGAVYFAVSEALTNVAKYAQAGHALVRSGWSAGTLTVEISDDGIGGADAGRGSGLRGLADRLAALDGSLEVVSPRGGGTRILGRIPTVAPTL